MNKYLVIYEYLNEGRIAEPVIETANQIFDKMDMSDCYDIEIRRLILINGYKLTECRFLGTWHNGNDPLRMEIKAAIPATIEQMEPFDVGYGTDH